MIPFDLSWWVWALLSLGFAWVASILSDSAWGTGSGKFVVNALRLVFVIVCVLCGIAAIFVLIGGY